MNGKKKFQIGDLVTFNCAGSKGKTLALVLDVNEGTPSRRAFGEYIPGHLGWIEVQWIQVAQWMPRVEHLVNRRGHKVQPGDIARHPASTAFEVAK